MINIINCTEADYRAHEALSQSDLKWILKSPQHFKERAKLMQASSPEMDFGTAFHMAVLEPAKFKATYKIIPTFWGATKDGKQSTQSAEAKAKKAAFMAANQGCTFLDEEDMGTLTGMLNSLAAHPLFSSLFTGGSAEVAALWEHRGHQCKGRADYFHTKHPLFGRCVIDLKTTKEGAPDAFSRRVLNLGYDFQAAFYEQGFKADRTIFVAVEKTFPYAIGVYDMSSWIDTGKAKIDKAWYIYEYCNEKNEWSSYTGNSLDLLPVPGWLASIDQESF